MIAGALGKPFSRLPPSVVTSTAALDWPGPVYWTSMLIQGFYYLDLPSFNLGKTNEQTKNNLGVHTLYHIVTHEQRLDVW